MRDEMGNVDSDALSGKVVIILPCVDGPASAVSGDERGASLREVAACVSGFGGEDGKVAVVVQVNKARANDEVFAVDSFRGGVDVELPDADDTSVEDGDVANLCGSAGAVENLAVFEQKVDVPQGHLRGGRGKVRSKESEGAAKHSHAAAKVTHVWTQAAATRKG